MPKYKVETKRVVTNTHYVEADNPFAAAASVKLAKGEIIENVVSRRGPVPGGVKTRKTAKKRVAKKVVKRTITPEHRAKLVENIAKARAAKAKKERARKRALKAA